MTILSDLIVIFFALVLFFLIISKAFIVIPNAIGEIEYSTNVVNFYLSIFSTLNKFPPDDFSFFSSTWNKYKNYVVLSYSNEEKSIKFYSSAGSRIIGQYINFVEVTQGSVLYYVGKDTYIDFDGKNIVFFLDGKELKINPKGW